MDLIELAGIVVLHALWVSMALQAVMYVACVWYLALRRTGAAEDDRLPLERMMDRLS